jgi:hypothetical protein
LPGSLWDFWILVVLLFAPAFMPAHAPTTPP